MGHTDADGASSSPSVEAGVALASEDDDSGSLESVAYLSYATPRRA